MCALVDTEVVSVDDSNMFNVSVVSVVAVIEVCWVVDLVMWVWCKVESSVGVESSGSSCDMFERRPGLMVGLGSDAVCTEVSAVEC